MTVTDNLYEIVFTLAASAVPLIWLSVWVWIIVKIWKGIVKTLRS